MVSILLSTITSLYFLNATSYARTHLKLTIPNPFRKYQVYNWNRRGHSTKKKLCSVAFFLFLLLGRFHLQELIRRAYIVVQQSYRNTGGLIPAHWADVHHTFVQMVVHGCLITGPPTANRQFTRALLLTSSEAIVTEPPSPSPACFCFFFFFFFFSGELPASPSPLPFTPLALGECMRCTNTHVSYLATWQLVP